MAKSIAGTSHTEASVNPGSAPRERGSTRVKNRRGYWAIRRLILATGALLAAMMIATACTDDDTEVATDPVRDPSASPTALAEVPASIEVAQVTIEDGSFDVDEIILQQGEPSILEVTNQDDRAYRLQIGDLLAPTDIPQGTTTRVEFTTPSSDQYEGELLASDGDDVVDDVLVTVMSGGATSP